MNIDIRDTTSVADRLRYSAQGFKEWRVQKLKDGEYIIFFSHWEGGAARQWFEDWQRRYPDSVRGYELALVDVKSERDALCNEAADELDRLRARVASLEESLHYANGVADLAMKHRDDAENRVAELEQDAEIGRKWRADSSLATWFPFTAEEIERLRGLIAAHVNASNNDDSAGDTFGALAEAVQDAP